MSGVDRKAVEPVIFCIDASGVPIEYRLSGGISSVGDREMIPNRFLNENVLNRVGKECNETAKGLGKKR